MTAQTEPDSDTISLMEDALDYETAREQLKAMGWSVEFNTPAQMLVYNEAGDLEYEVTADGGVQRVE